MSSFLSGREVFFSVDEIIVSKTDLKGIITYANDVFCRVSGYSEAEILGQPHNVLRHPEMPRCIFKLLWDQISSGREIFAYVNNRTKQGDFYWVFAHVTPSFGAKGKIFGYHSNRRAPDAEVIRSVVVPLYAELVRIEEGYANRKEGMMAAFDHLQAVLKSKGMEYDEFVHSF